MLTPVGGETYSGLSRLAGNPAVKQVCSATLREHSVGPIQTDPLPADLTPRGVTYLKMACVPLSASLRGVHPSPGTPTSRPSPRCAAGASPGSSPSSTPSGPASPSPSPPHRSRRGPPRRSLRTGSCAVNFMHGRLTGSSATATSCSPPHRHLAGVLHRRKTKCPEDDGDVGHGASGGRRRQAPQTDSIMKMERTREMAEAIQDPRAKRGLDGPSARSSGPRS